MNALFKSVIADVQGSITAKVLIVAVLALIAGMVSSMSAVRLERAHVARIQAESAAQIAALQHPSVEIKPKIIWRERIVIERVPGGNSWGNRSKWKPGSEAVNTDTLPTNVSTGDVVIVREREIIQDGGSVSHPDYPVTTSPADAAYAAADKVYGRKCTGIVEYYTDNTVGVSGAYRVLRSPDVSAVISLEYNLPGKHVGHYGAGIMVRF